MSARDYCKHGRYVGGCGIDWMCGPCELGEPDPTVRELHEQFAEAISLVVEAGVRFWTNAPFASYVGDRNMRQATATLGYIAEAREWATSDDDDEWLSRRHRAECDEDDAREDERRTVYTEIDEVHEYGFVP